MKRVKTAMRMLTALALTAALGGCATSWVVDSQVRSFSELPVGGTAASPATYRFERLPSQQAGEGASRADALEALAAPALESVGLRRDDASPRYTAQVGARVIASVSPWADPWFAGGPWGPGSRFGWGPGRGGWGGGWGGWGGWGPGYGAGWYGPMFPPASNPWYARDVSVILRDAASNRVVYETHAHNDGPYSVDAPVLRVMFQAALQGFPNPAQGERRVDIALPQARSPAPAPSLAP